jgi:3-hydroxyisobutyrate dehydrogenase-like beta-hydroxyacid dehydrogenase
MIGLGLIGTALAARLIDARIPVTGFDIDPARCSAFRDIGGAPADSAAQVFANCHTIVVAVYSAEQSRSLFDEIDPATAVSGTAMICTTTCAPAEILDIAERADAARLSLVEAPLSGTSAEVREGSAIALVAGRAHAIEAAGSVLGILFPRQTRVGQIGDAARTKLAINLILQNNRAALAEGDRIRGSHRPRPRDIPCDRPPIGCLFQGDGQQGPKDHRARFHAAVAYCADAEGRRADPR